MSRPRIGVSLWPAHERIVVDGVELIKTKTGFVTVNVSSTRYPKVHRCKNNGKARRHIRRHKVVSV